MASILKQSGGRRTIQFRGADSKRHSIRLGVRQHAAEGIRTHVEALVSASITAAHPLGRQIARLAR